jgi:hypothetical protein
MRRSFMRKTIAALASTAALFAALFGVQSSVHPTSAEAGTIYSGAAYSNGSCTVTPDYTVTGGQVVMWTVFDNSGCTNGLPQYYVHLQCLGSPASVSGAVVDAPGTETANYSSANCSSGTVSDVGTYYRWADGSGSFAFEDMRYHG